MNIIDTIRLAINTHPAHTFSTHDVWEKMEDSSIKISQMASTFTALLQKGEIEVYSAERGAQIYRISKSTKDKLTEISSSIEPKTHLMGSLTFEQIGKAIASYIKKLEGNDDVEDLLKENRLLKEKLADRATDLISIQNKHQAELVKIKERLKARSGLTFDKLGIGE